MVQQAQHAHVHHRENHKPVTMNDQVFTDMWHRISNVVSKVAVSAVNGFHLFVESAEFPNNRRDEYWWESPESAKKIIKR